MIDVIKVNEEGLVAALYLPPVPAREKAPATHPEVRLVVANVSSHVVWAGIDPDTWQRRSSWNLGGVGLPFVSLLRPPDASTSWRELFEETLRDAVAAADAAAIPVERIKGPILFVTGSDDGVWPSAEMADLAIERLKRHTFPFSYEHARYQDAGHAILMPPYRVGPINNPWPSSSYTPPRWLASAQIQLGGTSEGNRLARMAAWPAMTAFLAKHFQSNQERV